MYTEKDEGQMYLCSRSSTLVRPDQAVPHPGNYRHFQPWHLKEAEEVLALLDGGQEGLEEREAQRRLLEHGYNELPPDSARTLLSILPEQLSGKMILVLYASESCTASLTVSAALHPSF